MYSKQLIPLREIALTIKIKEASPSLLLKRLRFICKEEKVEIDDVVIRELAEVSNYDARSCINTI
jgi:DNA polymerase III delta prime subunit